MPWCESCSRFLNPPTLTAAGACPTCGTVLAEPPTAPWHFKLLVGAAGVYLAFRFLQGIAWVVHQL
ncbi:MAG TPA: hypothetical protein VM030_01730 [Acidimicrobiales bacterium]|nr:hypothetical protein [Acidimicrobiales bacterium]